MEDASIITFGHLPFLSLNTVISVEFYRAERATFDVRDVEWIRDTTDMGCELEECHSLVEHPLQLVCHGRRQVLRIDKVPVRCNVPLLCDQLIPILYSAEEMERKPSFVRARLVES